MARLHKLSPGEEITLTEHLDELRSRIMVMIGAVGAAFVVAFWQHEQIIKALNRQLPTVTDANGHQQKIVPVALGVTEKFTNAVLVAFFAGLLIALPVVFWQIYAFVIPAFNQTIGKRVIPIIAVVSALFLGGAAFGYLVVLPAAAKFLIGFDSTLYQNLQHARDYYTFAMLLMLIMGIIFELPAAIATLSALGIVNSRMLRKNRRYAILILAVVAAALPTIDPISMMLELVPLLVLFEISIWIARLIEIRRPVPEPLSDPPLSDPPAGTWR
jgi:sec-independent protein translocase protein TatC